ncbi:MAG: ferritin-like fold-containing protein [Brooklawnia sp.]|uniref:ferritin-like fold-containing protein n=1 Tax=Brooklawnia sp. TaxID=2699740 RepID=UPI003C732D68
MNTEMAPDPGTALLAVLAYQNLRVAESLLTRAEEPTELADRLPVARVAADALTRFTLACDAIPGGQTVAQQAMEPIVSPVDEFWAMTRPRSWAEQRLRVMVVASTELEVVQRALTHVPEMAAEAIGSTAAAWRAIDHGSQAAVAAVQLGGNGSDELSLYARRLLGETAVMCQRVIVRQPALRVALTGGMDEELTASTAVLDEVLAAVAARVAGLGLSA